jgi:hypothetical protein
MKAHELGQKLLDGPNRDVVIPAELSNDYILRLSNPVPGTVLTSDEEEESVVFLAGDEDDCTTWDIQS